MEKKQKKFSVHRWYRVLAVLLVLCLALSYLNMNSILAYAEDSAPVTVDVGENVSAVLQDGILTLSGQGNTADFSAETAPFLPYAEEIHTLLIEDGITYIGSYLCYGLRNLKGVLRLPESISGLGDYAFSGSSQKDAPAFTEIHNEFTGTDTVMQQAIEHPETIFSEGQSGTMDVSEHNLSFFEAAQAAGYSMKSESVEALPDDMTEPELPASEEAAAVSEASETYAAEAAGTVYVNQETGSDETGTGTEAAPYQTIEKAAAGLQEAGAGSTVDDNKIIIIGTYELQSRDFLNENPIPVTIAGNTGDCVLKGPYEKGQDKAELQLYLYDGVCFENIIIKNINHIYGNGHDITIGKKVVNATKESDDYALGFYLYGSGQHGLVGNSVGKISVYSGTTTRIVGYVRNNSSINTSGLKADITVGGTANVSTVVAGSASGAVTGADVAISVEGGYVGTLIGGNQGFSNILSPYEGDTSITISGGTVSTILGAGSGRAVSIPTYCGSMKIDVTGGSIGNIYGAGSAAYVLSKDNQKSEVNISVTGGSINNIFAAGKGGDNSVAENENIKFSEKTPPGMFGSMTGTANITVGGNAVINGSIYASGEGYVDQNYGTENAFLSGSAVITVQDSSIVKGNVYGGGKGLKQPGYESCARVEADSSVEIRIEGGSIENNVYGGGENGIVKGKSIVYMGGGTVKGNVYGGGENGLHEGKTEVQLGGGIVEGSLYGGALGTPGERLVYGGSTVNMTGGWIRGNLYGGSELSDDGPKPVDGESSADLKDLIFVNLAGGTVSGNVFGGGYRGTVNGSTHLHIGADAPNECAYYANHQEEKPSLSPAALAVEGSVYAGGDYGGGDTVDYTTITVNGTSHVYIDGTGYNTGVSGNGSDMVIAGGVFGSGASCDAGATRLVTLKNYGSPVRDETGIVKGTTRTLAAIQRADRVILTNSHVKLTGQSDVANSNQTALYSLNRIGNHGNSSSLGTLGNSLVLQGGSTLVLESAVNETANYKSVDEDGNSVAMGQLETCPNTVVFDTGTVFRIASANEKEVSGEEIYGEVSGYTYLLADDKADAYAYARVKTDSQHKTDGGFVDPENKEKELEYTNVGTQYRYWRIQGKESAAASRHMVLTAQTLAEGDSGFGSDGYSVAEGTIELPPAAAGSSYMIQSITIPTETNLVLADAAKKGAEADRWVTAAENSSNTEEIILEQEKQKIQGDSAFGLFMKMGSGFSDADGAPGKVISRATAAADGKNSIIGQKTASVTAGGTPYIDFTLTYKNQDIAVSKTLGTVVIELMRNDGSVLNMNVEIVTKAKALADQTVELYASQRGSYTGRMIIPSGASRNLKLTKVTAPSSFVTGDGQLEKNNFAVSMLPVKSQGWNTAGLLTEAYDLKAFTSSPVAVGTTDSRYQASIEFTLQNAPGFPAKAESDEVTLTFSDENSGEFQVLLKIHWKDSIVSEVKTVPGRQYNKMSAQNTPRISQKSAVTAAFTLSGDENVSNLWLELRRGESGTAVLYAETRLTVILAGRFYSYQITGEEAADKVSLSQFTQMWESTKLAGNISKDTVLTVIMDFGKAEGVSNDDYSLRLRSDTSADSAGADFTVYNEEAAVSLSADGGLSRGEYTFHLNISPNTDTNLMDGAAAVFYPENGSLPEGVVFKYQGEEYYPSGGKVYVPLGTPGSHDLVMNTLNSAGLAAGNLTFKAEIYPIGQSAGEALKTWSASCSCNVTENPEQALLITLESESRIVKAGTQLTFAADYSVTGEGEHAVTLTVQKKENGAYQPAENWQYSGGQSITNTSGTETIDVTVPVSAAAGTYRLWFGFGEQSVPYNIIVE
ncbi:hypothetical protein [Lactonifactor longoviformis]|uniref:Leucine rich repeat-containing protein n=2 Tax=Lactonifactor TaxID=420345 RepID=A0A1M5BL60_9CLOT|nr:hypothetical protein [Lactonifactor longoviformis]SHF43323.1 hypothetical protein SAMN02745158_03707 [Lactonifactor longoviformis DSM 17459]